MTRLFVALSILLGALLAVAPAAPADAARPVCATSSKASIKRQKAGSRDRARYVWARVCVDGQDMQVSVRQKNFGYQQKVEATIDAHVKISLYSTTSDGKFLRDLEFEQTVWLGDLALKFATGAAGRRGFIMYAPSMPVETIDLPELPAGTYRLEFTLLLDPAEQSPGDPTAQVATRIKQIKFKV